MGILIDLEAEKLYEQVLELVSGGRTLTQIARLKHDNGQRIYPNYVEMLTFFENRDNKPWHLRYKKALVLQTRSLENKAQDIHDYMFHRCLENRDDLKLETVLKVAKSYHEFVAKRRESLEAFVSDVEESSDTVIRFEYVDANPGVKKDYGFRPIDEEDDDE